MNKLGVHAFVWEKGWSHEECARAIGRTAEVGYDLIEISVMDPKLVDIEDTLDRWTNGRDPAALQEAAEDAVLAMLEGVR